MLKIDKRAFFLEEMDTAENLFEQGDKLKSERLAKERKMAQEFIERYTREHGVELEFLGKISVDELKRENGQ